MRVRVITAGSPHTGAQPGGGAAERPATYGGWLPRAVLGADSLGGLLLPQALPTSAQLYAPRGVWTDGRIVVAADTGNHRVLIWHQVPSTDGVAADVVLGQPDAISEGAAAGGRGAANGMNLPTGVLVHDGRLVVADAWHHRILVWDAIPERTGTPPDHVLGQPDPEAVQPNAGGEPTAGTFYWPFGIGVLDGRFHVTDTGNRRVLIWADAIPEPGRPADVVLGQPTPADREENRGAAVAADSFRWPHAVARTPSGGLLVADAGNHRVLRWDAPPQADRPADGVLGQPDFSGGTEFPYVSQSGRLRFPYGLSAVDGGLAVADTANNRVLLYGSTDVTYDQRPDVVLGQPTDAANGENRWDAVGPDTLCWPYGLHWHRDSTGGADRIGGTDGTDGVRGGDLIAIADSGNNRIVLWQRP